MVKGEGQKGKLKQEYKVNTAAGKMKECRNFD